MSDMLKTYSLKFKGKKDGKKDYELNFKVANNVDVTYKQVGDINEIHLASAKEMKGTNDKTKNYNVAGPLNVQFFEDPAVGAGKDGVNVADGKPKVVIGIQP